MSTFSKKLLFASSAAGDNYWISERGYIGADDQSIGVAVDLNDDSIYSAITAQAPRRYSIVIKHDTDGEFIFGKVHDTDFVCESLGVEVNQSNGNFIAITYNDSEDPGTLDQFVQYDSNGNVLNDRTIGDIYSSTRTNDTATDLNNNIVGCTAYDGLIYVYKLSANDLSIDWSYDYSPVSGSGEYRSPTIATDSVGNVILCGDIYEQYDTDIAVLLKLDSSGNFIYGIEVTNDANDDVKFGPVAVDSSDNIYVVERNTDNSQLVEIIKFASNGATQFAKGYSTPYITNPSSGTIQIRDMTIDSDDNIIGVGGKNNNLLIYKFDSSGNVLWANVLEHIGGKELAGGRQAKVTVNSNNDIIIVAEIEDANDPDILTIKLPSDGSGTGIIGNNDFDYFSITVNESTINRFNFTSNTGYDNQSTGTYQGAGRALNKFGINYDDINNFYEITSG